MGYAYESVPEHVANCSKFENSVCDSESGTIV